MSRRPATAVPASIFARLREHLAKFPGDVIPLQIGDTHLPPPARLDELAWSAISPAELYAYGSPNGWAPLVEAIRDKVATHNRIGITTAGIQVTCGATHALSCAVQALCDPGDELILMTPHWPLIRGIALGFNVVPVEVPFGDLAAAEAAITPRTSAIYFATPNNPDGAMLSTQALGDLAQLAVRRGLWILSDEVYEHYGYDAHTCLDRRAARCGRSHRHGVLVREELRAGRAPRRLRARARSGSRRR